MCTGIRTCISAIAGATLLVAATHRAIAQARVDTLESGRIVVSNPDSPHAGPEGVPTLVEELRIGSIEGACDSFGAVFSLAVDDGGRIYVADRQTNDIRVFSARGECLGTFGRPGEGPGEFGMLAGIAWQPPGYLWAIDALRNRATVFDSLGTVLATHPLQLGRAASLPWRLWVDDAGSFHFWSPGFRRIVEYGVGPGLDSLAGVPQPMVPPGSRMEYTREAGSGDSRITMQMVIPHAPRVQWAVNSAGNIWQAHTSAFTIHETTYAGDTLRTIRLDREPPRLEGRERDSIAEATGLAARRLPEHKHAIRNIRTSPDGWLWIETEKGATRAWDVFDEEGYYVGRVESPVPIEKTPFPVFTAGMLTGVTLGELDEAYVVRLRVVR